MPLFAEAALCRKTSTTRCYGSPRSPRPACPTPRPAPRAAVPPC